MQIINNDQYGFYKQIEDRMKNNDTIITYEMVDEIPTSPANKRAIWHSVKIVKEITKIMKSEPKNIYVEFAREEQKKNYVPTPVEIKPDKKDISIEPTAEDILLMEEYRRGVYQGD